MSAKAKPKPKAARPSQRVMNPLVWHRSTKFVNRKREASRRQCRQKGAVDG